MQNMENSEEKGVSTLIRIKGAKNGQVNKNSHYKLKSTPVLYLTVPLPCQVASQNTAVSQDHLVLSSSSHCLQHQTQLSHTALSHHQLKHRQLS